MMIRYSSGLVAVALASLVAASGSQAQMSGLPLPGFTVSTAVTRQVQTVEVVNYRMRSATPPWPVEFVDAAAGSCSSSINSFVARMSAMREADYPRWLEGWDAESRLVVAASDVLAGRSIDYWTNWWRSVFTGMRPYIRKQIATEDEEIIIYSMLPIDDSTVEAPEVPVVFRSDAGCWKATQALRDSPFLATGPWSTGEDRISLVAR